MRLSKETFGPHDCTSTTSSDLGGIAKRGEVRREEGVLIEAVCRSEEERVHNSQEQGRMASPSFEGPRSTCHVSQVDTADIGVETVETIVLIRRGFCIHFCEFEEA